MTEDEETSELALKEFGIVITILISLTCLLLFSISPACYVLKKWDKYWQGPLTATAEK